MSARRRSLLRRLRNAALLLLAAAALNIFIAAAAAVWSRLSKTNSGTMLTRYVKPTGFETVFGDSTRRAEFAEVIKRAERDWLELPRIPGEPAMSHATRASGLGYQITDWQRTDSRAGQIYTLARAGWPFPAFNCESLYPVPPAAAGRWPPPRGVLTWKCALFAPPWLHPAPGIRPTSPRPLPYHPIPAGLIANTALYAAALWLLSRIPSTLRRRAFEQHYLCPHCSYDLKGVPPMAPCPECGKEIPNTFRL